MYLNLGKILNDSLLHRSLTKFGLAKEFSYKMK